MWDYMIREFSADNVQLEAWLKDAGRMGWELVQYQQTNPGTIDSRSIGGTAGRPPSYRLVLKQPLGEEQ